MMCPDTVDRIGILDTCYRNGNIELWGKDTRGKTVFLKVPWSPSFYLHLPNIHEQWEMLDALSGEYNLREHRFNTVYGPCDGFRVGAGRRVADAILEQTAQEAKLYNVDTRPDHWYMAEQGIFPCGIAGESRFSPVFAIPGKIMEIDAGGNPFTLEECRSVRVHMQGEKRDIHIEGAEKTVIGDLATTVETWDPDIIIFPGADTWVPRIVAGARRYGMDPPFTRSGFYRRIAARSYFSYGRTEYREGSLVPDGRVLIDPRTSFNYHEGGIYGVVLAARLTGICPNLAARFTAGTLISGYEVYEALCRGIAVPYRKHDPEVPRGVESLRSCDRGGMMFQPSPGLYEDVFQIDFTSLYPAVIVRYNLSPETLAHPERAGFLPGVLAPLLALRHTTKRLKNEQRYLSGADSILKWMLVTCFGYTGYKNAKFGRIEVHEKITARSRDVLIRSKRIAEEHGFTILHGIVDSLWLKGPGRESLKAWIEEETLLHTELESYDWLAFLPMPDGFGAYTRYYGRLADGSLKVRGIACRRGDTPAFIRRTQEDLLGILVTARSRDGIRELSERVATTLKDAETRLWNASPGDMTIHRRVSRLDYTRKCPEASAVRACRAAGIHVMPGMEIGYVVRDAASWEVDLAWEADGFDTTYYRELLHRAGEEVIFALREAGGKPDTRTAG